MINQYLIKIVSVLVMLLMSFATYYVQEEFKRVDKKIVSLELDFQSINKVIHRGHISKTKGENK